jgi:hypothetical protein
MTPVSQDPNQFLIEAFDRDMWCPVAQTLFRVADIAPLCAILGAATEKDPDLYEPHELDDAQLAARAAQFGVTFDHAGLASRDIVISLARRRRLSDAPYLIHTRYELPLLLEGRKKLACMSDDGPQMGFSGKHRFDHWAAEGLLHREEVIEPDTRTVTYYTPKGEEWRIPAYRLIERAGSGRWNAHYERLVGMLFGYEDWQNDWWIDVGVTGKGFGRV